VSWEQLPQPSTFGKARRREAYRRFAGIVAGSSTSDLLPLDEVRDRLRIFEQAYVGVRPIPVDQIVGSAGRSRDFDRRWLPLRPETRSRWRRVEEAFPEGSFPPIIVYQLDRAYFVVDGHHRVAIAKQRGVDYIDAEVTLLRSRYDFPPGTDIAAVIMREQQRIFMEESALDRARPEARIEFSKPLGYVELLELVEVHGYHLIKERNALLEREEVAEDWYDRVFLPTVEEIRQRALRVAFPRSTEGDLFLLVYQRRRALLPERGGIGLDETVRTVSAAEHKRPAVKARQAVGKLKDRT
jgi:ParB-like nuclease domain